MATETVERRAAHRRGIKVTSVASISGVAAGLLSATIASGPDDVTGTFALAAALLGELALLRVVGVDVEDFSTKDHLYVVFMTFSLWFITWTILLTTGATP